MFFGKYYIYVYGKYYIYVYGKYYVIFYRPLPNIRLITANILANTINYFTYII